MSFKNDKNRAEKTVVTDEMNEKFPEQDDGKLRDNELPQGGRRRKKKKDKKGRKKKSGPAGAIVAAILVFFAAAFVFLEIWVFTTWTGLRMDEIIYQLNAPLEGTGNGMITKGFTHSGIPAVIILAVFLIIFIRLRKSSHRKAFLRTARIASLAVMAVVLGVAWGKLDLGSWLSNQLNASTFIEDNYVDPAKTEVTFPQKKRNLIYIYLESMEMTYADTENGGAFSYNNIPELTQLSEENENFSGTTDKLDGGRVLPGTTYTMAAMFGQTSGLPLKVDLSDAFTDARGSFNKMNTQEHFFDKITCLGDMLEDQGYKNVLMLGSNATFGGRRLYFTKHGNYEMDDYQWAIDQGIIPSDYYVFWGMEDQKLFAAARDRLTELAAGDEPFNLTMLTVDTHFEDGYTCDLCPTTYGSNSYANVMACSSKQVSEFVKWIQQQDWYDNTTVIINGDHTTMDSDFCNDVPDDYARKTYTAYINSAVEPEDPTRYREYTTLDSFPTTLAALGCTIEGNRLGLGTNLFSSEDTLLEQYGFDELSDQLERKSEWMDSLADINVYSEDLMEAQGLTPSSDITMTGVDRDAGTISFRVENIENIYEKISSVELKITDNKGTSESVQMTQDKEDKGVYTADADLNSFNYKDASVTVVVNGKSGGEYEAGRMTGDLSLKLTDINAYLDALADNPQYTILLALRDDGTHSLTTEITDRLARLGFKEYLPGHYRWSYYGVVTPDGLEAEELSQDELSHTGTLADGRTYSIISQGGLSGAGGGAGRYLTCSVKIDGIEYAVQRIGLNFVIYDTENSVVVDSVEFNTYMGLGAVRKDISELEETAEAAREQSDVTSTADTAGTAATAAAASTGSSASEGETAGNAGEDSGTASGK